MREDPTLAVEKENRRVVKRSTTTLSEADSKKILKAFGIPVVKETVAANKETAVLEAATIGFPVVLKALGPDLTHKTELGLVAVNLRSEEEVRQACRHIKKAAGGKLEGYLVQPLVEGRREFVAGLFTDPQFGPCVMFGLGGIFTEAIGDVVFRIAPVDRFQALAMVREIQSAKLLDAFRGEDKADIDELVATITGLSDMAIERPEIKEVDINPLIVAPGGQVKAVDALVVLEEKEKNETGAEKNLGAYENKKDPREIRKAIDVMINARSIAVIGAKRSIPGGFPGIFANIRNFGYPGKLYAINPNVDEIDGITAYPDLVSLPEKVDLVIISVPGKLVPAALKDCAASGNRNIHIFTSGFQESQEEEGITLYRKLEEIAGKENLHIIGPNCMGLYVPKNRIVTWVDPPGKYGPVSMISQSGGNAQEFTHYASTQYRIYFNKVISYGNALTLDSTDFFDYLAQDDTTGIITMYMEGVKDGRRLLELVSQTNAHKPVLIFKGGMTDSGGRAVSSHTGAMAGNRAIWEAFFRQTGAVKVNSLEEMADVTAAFYYLKKTRGKRVVVLSVGGGAGVSVADTCAVTGMELPELSPGTIKKIRKFIPPAGNMIRNPIDSVIIFRKQDLLGEIFDILVQSGEVDNFIVSLPLDWMYDKKEGGRVIEDVAGYLAGEGRARLSGKPLVVAWRQYQPSPEIRNMISVLENTLFDVGVPVYEGLHRSIFALSKLAKYSEFHGKNPLNR